MVVIGTRVKIYRAKENVIKKTDWVSVEAKIDFIYAENPVK